MSPLHRKGVGDVIEKKRKYLIVEKSRLVGEDLADIVREYDPLAEVALVSDLAAAESYAEGVRELSLAFVGGAHKTDVIDPLARTLAVSGGRIVLMRDFSERSEAARRDWLFLPQPFTTGSVFRLLAASDGSGGESGATR